VSHGLAECRRNKCKMGEELPGSTEPIATDV
jgi:hypothetical protein